MSANNQLAQSKSFSVEINTSRFRASILNSLRDPERARRFTTAIVSAVSTNAELQKCDTGSIVTAALLGESLNLSPSPQLGHYYLVPYGNKAQFQLGYKGYVQLAIRSGQYKKLNVLPIKQGELIRFDPLNEEIEVNLIEDAEAREEAKTVGYYAMFEYLNGFRKALYWTRAKMEKHASSYSKGYRAKSGHSFWEKNFDEMACKTMLRQLISKWGIMSIEMQKAMENDMGVIHEDGSADFLDSPEDEPEIIKQEEPEMLPQAENAAPVEHISMSDL